MTGAPAGGALPASGSALPAESALRAASAIPGGLALPARLRLVTWNIRAGIGPGEPFPPAWWRHVRRDRLEQIGRFLVALEPDVVTLQEVAVLTLDGQILDQPAELARWTGLHAQYAATHAFTLVEPASGRAIGSALWGNAILSRAPLADAYATGLPRAADEDVVEVSGALEPTTGRPHPLIAVAYADAEPGHREPRSMVGGTMADPIRAEVATTHLTYIGRDQRRRQASEVRATLDQRAGPAILTGDFNTAIDAPELAALEHGFLDAFAAVGIPVLDPRRASCGPWPIDHVRVRGLKVIECRVIDAGDLSDHQPVLAVLDEAGSS